MTERELKELEVSILYRLQFKEKPCKKNVISLKYIIDSLNN